MATRQLTDKVNLRTSPEKLATNFTRTMQVGETFDPIGGSATCDGYPWQRVQTSRGEHGWIITGWDEEAKPGPVIMPVPATALPDGFHAMDTGADFTVPLSLANQGKLGMMLCLDGNGLNNFVGKVPYLVFRPYLVPGVNAAPMNGTQDDIQAAKNWFAQVMAPRIASIHQSAILQGPCEANSVKRGFSDAYWYIGFMQACEAIGRKAVIFNDSVASFGVLKWDGWSSAQLRYPALQYAKAHGHFVGAHMYGAKGGSFPGSGSTDDEWLMWGGRWQEAYGEVPEDAHADVLGTEEGLFDVKNNQAVGPTFIADDLKGFRRRKIAWSCYKAGAYWACGFWHEAPTCNLNPMMHDIAAAL